MAIMYLFLTTADTVNHREKLIKAVFSSIASSFLSQDDVNACSAGLFQDELLLPVWVLVLLQGAEAGRDRIHNHRGHFLLRLVVVESINVMWCRDRLKVLALQSPFS